MQRTIGEETEELESKIGEAKNIIDVTPEEITKDENLA